MDDFNLTYDNSNNEDSISNQVILVCASNATKKINGVLRLVPLVGESMSKKLLGKETLTEGIKIIKNKNETNLDVYLIIEYGKDILNVAWEVQKNIKKEVEEMTDIKLNNVNIFVQGVDLVNE